MRLRQDSKKLNPSHFRLPVLALILSYLSGTCTSFFADISGRNFLSSQWTFLSGIFPGGGRGVHVHPPAYAPATDFGLFLAKGSVGVFQAESWMKWKRYSDRCT